MRQRFQQEKKKKGLRKSFVSDHPTDCCKPRFPPSLSKAELKSPIALTQILYEFCSSFLNSPAVHVNYNYGLTTNLKQFIERINIASLTKLPETSVCS